MKMTTDDVSINELIYSSNSISQLTDMVGNDVLKRIIQIFGGDIIFIPVSESVSKNERDSNIYKEFNGHNYRELVREYMISVWL